MDIGLDLQVEIKEEEHFVPLLSQQEDKTTDIENVVLNTIDLVSGVEKEVEIRKSFDLESSILRSEYLLGEMILSEGFSSGIDRVIRFDVFSNGEWERL